MVKMFDSSSSSPFEAFLFTFNFSTILNNVCTWLALITATFTFRRIRSSSSTTAGKLFSTPANDQNNRPDPLPDSHLPSAAVVPSWLSAETSESSTMGKFKEYYDRDANEDDDVCVGEMITSCCRRFDVFRFPVECEKMLRLRMMELSWYDFQDLTVIDGNVVKFWTAGDLHR
ncbi:uncharacterized protein LOC124943163 [Impatiens glandulifera]|uniref:uncharacterized protein LOC124943163 n=1 Tax=Impatiens glandulifera TaxID=253017 RepID=UPI001FB08329|nr:uncharacterized protein LOC124943163 [Impatiens glandulifera]